MWPGAKNAQYFRSPSSCLLFSFGLYHLYRIWVKLVHELPHNNFYYSSLRYNELVGQCVKIQTSI